MEIKEICKNLGISVTEFYKYMNTNQPKLSYYKKNNPVRYKDTITFGIINFYNLEHEELLTILKLYKLQQTK